MLRLAVAILSGIAASCGSAVLLGLLLGPFTFGTACIALCLGAGTALVVFRSVAPPERRDLSVWDWVACAAFGLFAVRAFGWLVWREGPKAMLLSPDNTGDLSLHLTYIEWLARGARWWPSNPIYAGQPLRYPLGMDLWNALLNRVGVDLFTGLIFTGLVLAAVTCLALHRWGRAFTVAGFLFNGGLAALPLFWTFSLEDYQSHYGWTSLPLTVLVTQRGLLWALPAGLLILCSWRSRFFPPTGVARKWKLPFALECGLYAFMPLFHFHTFLFLSALLGCWFLCVARLRRSIALLVGIALIPASLWVTQVTGLMQSQPNPAPSSFASTFGTEPEDSIAEVESAVNAWLFQHRIPLWLHSGWVQDENSPPAFWLQAFGILPLLAGLTAWRILRQRQLPPPERPGALASAFFLPALAIFLFCLNVMFARWHWDNIKLLLWGYLVMLPFIHDELLARWRPAPRVLCLCLLFFSGALSLGLGLTRTGTAWCDMEELATVRRMTSHLEPGAIFCGAPLADHPLLLTGHPMAAGFSGHLWTHGIAPRERLEEVRAIMTGAPGWEAIARKLQVEYVYWGPREEARFGSPAPAWRNPARIVAAESVGTIYRLTP